MGLSKTFLAIGIAIIFAVFVSYAVYVVYEPPPYDYNSYNNDCSQTYDCQKQITDCQAGLTYSDPQYQNCRSTVTATAEYQACQKLLEECNNEAIKQTPRYAHARNNFYIFMVIALAALVAGAFIAVEGVGSGLIGGGILLVLWSLMYTGEYWLTLNKFVKLFALAIVLGLLIFLGYKKIERK